MKVAFLTNIISPYRRPVLQNLASTPGWDLRVFVNRQREFDRPDWTGACEGVDVVQTRTWSVKRKQVALEPVRVEQTVELHLPLRLGRDLDAFDPDVVITHELGPRSLAATRWCRRRGRPLVVWSYQSRSSATSGGRLRRWMREHILGSAAACVGMGVQAREVLRGFGVPDDRIVDAPNATDPTMFRDRVARSRADGTIERLRREIGNGRKIAIVSGRMMPLKGIDLVIDLWRRLPREIADAWQLVFLGSGPMEAYLELVDDVRWKHYAARPMDEVADFYAASDLHVFASLVDVWGLVVNETMLCGVPTLCSIHAGCADDAIAHGENGFLFDPLEPDAAYLALHEALTHPSLEVLGKAAERRGAEFTVERLADGFRTAVDRARTRDVVSKGGAPIA